MKFKIYCINLYEREDRYNIVKEQFNKYKLDVHFIRNYKHKLGGRYGCFDSHIQCLKDAKKNKIDVCLIFEDDIVLDKNCNKYINECLNFIKHNKNVEYVNTINKIIYLQEKYDNNFYIGKAWGTYTLFLTKNAIIKILKNYKKYIGTNLHYDHFLYFLFGHMYIYEKKISHLIPMGSDNSNWGNDIITIFSQKLTNYTLILDETKELCLKNYFKFIILNNFLINYNTKLLNLINFSIYNKGNKDIGIEKLYFKYKEIKL